MRRFVWGATIGLAITIVTGHLVAFANGEWPYYQNKVASHRAMEWTRRLAIPGAMLGGITALFVHRRHRS